MADNTNGFEAGFGIQETMTIGAGNQKLAEDLFSPETSTVDTKDLSPIIEDAEPSTKKEDPVKDKSLTDFLYGDGDGEGDDDDDDAAAQKVVTTSETTTEKPSTTKETPKDIDASEDEPKGGISFEALSKDLVNLGIFTQDEGEELNIADPDAFLERFTLEKQKGANEMVGNFIAQFGEDYQNAFDAIFVKGVDPKKYFETSEVISNFSEMDLTKEDNQKRVLRQALKDQGFDSEDIESEIERIENYGDLEKVAEKHHKVLIKKESKKLEELEISSQQKLQEKAAIRNQYITNVQSVLGEKLKEKEFDGIPLNPKLATELQDFLLVDKWKTPTGETLSDFDKAILDLKQPQNHAMKVKVALLLKTLEKDPTLSSIQRKGKTKSNDQLFGNLANQTTSSKNSTDQNKPVVNRWFK